MTDEEEISFREEKGDNAVSFSLALGPLSEEEKFGGAEPPEAVAGGGGRAGKLDRRATLSDQKVRSKSGAISVKDFSTGIPSMHASMSHVCDHHGEDSTSAKILRVIHNDSLQRFLAVLLCADILVLITEIMLMAIFPPCDIVCKNCHSECEYDGDKDYGHRFLGGGTGYEYCEAASPDKPGGLCDKNLYKAVHNFEYFLFAVTVAILFLFFVELNLEMIFLIALEFVSFSRF